MIEPPELRFVERRSSFLHPLKGEGCCKFFPRHHFPLVFRMPAEKGEKIHDRIRKVSFFPVVEDIFRSVPLGELLLAIGSQNRRQYRVGRRFLAERFVKRKEPRSARDEFFAAYDMRHAYLDVIDDMRKIIRRVPVALDQNEIIECFFAGGKRSPDHITPCISLELRYAEAKRTLPVPSCGFCGGRWSMFPEQERPFFLLGSFSERNDI